MIENERHYRITKAQRARLEDPLGAEPDTTQGRSALSGGLVIGYWLLVIGKRRMTNNK